MTGHQELINDLERVVETLTGASDLTVSAHDRSGLPADGLPLAVVRPTSVAEVQAVLRLTAGAGVGVVPRGAGTGLAGGAVAGRGTLVLDLSGLNRILSIDPDARRAVVEPGVITADLDAAARRHGLRYAPDPASAAISTIGGNIATNAGGLRCVKYGVTRDAVRTLDVVLADGRLLHTGSATAKSVTGYDLTGLFVGSEGTLGVIVGATVDLHPLPAVTATLSASFDTAESAATAVSALRRAGVGPSVAELLDAATLGAIDAHRGGDLRRRGGALLLLQTEGLAAVQEIELAAAVIAPVASEVTVAGSDAEAEGLLSARRAALPAIERRGRVLIEDICVPVTRLAEAFTAVAGISSATGVPIYCFAHAGDGNLHPIIVVEGAGPADPIPAHVAAAADRVFQLALDLGGTVTGEHGVGVLKRDWVARELDPVALEVQHAIRRTLDPSGLLNPGKAL